MNTMDFFFFFYILSTCLPSVVDSFASFQRLHCGSCFLKTRLLSLAVMDDCNDDPFFLCNDLNESCFVNIFVQNNGK